MIIYKTEKQDQLAGLSYQPGQGMQNQAEAPEYFDSLEAAEAHLVAVASVDPAKVLNGPAGRVYKGILCNYIVTEIAVKKQIGDSMSEDTKNIPEVLKTDLAAKGIDVSLEAPMNEAELKEVRESIANLDADGDMKEKLDKLLAALEASSKTGPAGQVLRVTDQVELAKKYLSEAAQITQANRATTLIAVDDNKKVFQALYLTTVVRKGNEERGVEALSEILNELSANGLIHSTLSPLSSLALATIPLQNETVVVFTFVLVPIEKRSSLMYQYPNFAVEEGGIGEPLEDLGLDLAEGEFLTTIRLAYNFTQDKVDSKEERLQKEINQLLAILPAGTEVKEIRACSVSDLSLPYDVRLYNPLMKDIKYVELEYTRQATLIGEQVKEFNLITGVKYLDANNERLFR